MIDRIYSRDASIEKILGADPIKTMIHFCDNLSHSLNHGRRRGLVLVAASCVVIGSCWPARAQTAKPLYQADFDKAEVGKIPTDLLVLDGAFAVQQEGANRFLELPGAPLESYGFLFGPTEKDGIAASARIYATSKGRRYPTFALGLDGVGGYRLQVSPGKKLLELCRGEDVKASVPYQWESGKWTELRLRVLKSGTGWRVEGKAWQEGAPPPTSWTISTDDAEDLPAGRGAIFASPYSGTPIRFDDLLMERVSDGGVK
jgi:hypothetical protein